MSRDLPASPRASDKPCDPTTGRFVILIIHRLSPKMFTTRAFLVWMPLKS
jgi:hypothetical protein